MDYFAGYLDILGTKELVLRGKFSDYHTFDFTGAVLSAALEFESSRFAAFSDCVIFSTPLNRPQDLIEILIHLYGNWVDDGIFVRGGIAMGSLRWVDFNDIDKEIQHLKNFSCARLYGKAISEAVDIERSSGPGILPFASDAVADKIDKVDKNSVLRLSSNVLRCFDYQKLDVWIDRLNIYAEHEHSSQAMRHIKASIRVLKLFESNKAFGNAIKK